MRVGSDKIEVELVERSLGEEVGAAGEGFDFEELVFDEAMDGLDVALVGVSARGDALVLRAEEGDGAGEAIAGAVRLQCANKLAAVIGLPSQVGEVDAAALEMGLDALSNQFTGSFGAALGEGQENQAAADVACGVLDGRQAKALRLRPVGGEIIQVLGMR